MPSTTNSSMRSSISGMTRRISSRALNTTPLSSMLNHPPCAFFQPLETFFAVFPIIGNFSRVFSNHWKNRTCFFQSLETFFAFFPIIGNFSGHFSNHWKLFPMIGKIVLEAAFCCVAGSGGALCSQNNKVGCMSLELKVVDNVCVIVLDDTLGKQNVEAFTQLFRNEVRENGMRNFICDARHLRFLDTAGLSGLMACLKLAVEQEGDLRLAHMGDEPLLIFQTTNADKVLRIYESVAAALTSYQHES
ncbi:MAG: anti-sigma factor antagonist [Spartobacteria bacterium]|nr:anti-sigma factor antagonist [Spartobacteria bacterium]